MIQESLYGRFFPQEFGLQDFDLQDDRTRKNYPDDNYILVRNGKRKNVEISIASKEAKEIINYYKTDKFDYFIDEKSGALFFVPGDSVKLYVSGNNSHYMFSITKKSEALFKAIGKFRRLFVFVVQNTNHLLIIPDRKNKNNE